MPRGKSIASTGAKPYASVQEYYSDRLALLDIRIRQYLHRRQLIRGESTDEHLRGLIISEEEVEQLLQMSDMGEIAAAADGSFAQELAANEASIRARLASTGEAVLSFPLHRLSKRLNLSAIEEEAVFLCLAPELNRKYEKLFGYIQDDVTCKHATAELALQLLCSANEQRWEAAAALLGSGPLTAHLLLQSDAEDRKSALLTQAMKLDDRLVHILLFGHTTGSALPEGISIVSPADELAPLLTGFAFQDSLASFLKGSFNERAGAELLYIWGPPGAGKKLHLKHACRLLGKPIVVCNLSNCKDESSLIRAVRFTLREAIVQDGIACFDKVASLGEENVLLTVFMNALQRSDRLTVLLSETEGRTFSAASVIPFTETKLPIPDISERASLWESFAVKHSFAGVVDWTQLANKFRLTTGQIDRALKHAKRLAPWYPDYSPVRLLHVGCHAQVQHQLTRKAKRIEPRSKLDDVVLPPEQKEQLRNACNQMKYRHIVFGQWGFDRKLSYGKGISMMFAGPPGTGKTMSAEVIAGELQLELYKIDLSQVISKYIGETEKNLNEIFFEAQNSNAILFFDEADAIFGKRSEVKDSHDKYANIETAYLLQKMEEYEGISILATNYSQNIDEAFLRRINYVIKFPFPDAGYREQIWRGMFPPETPVAADIDFAFIADRLQLAGGNIKNIVVSAAFLAADNGSPIGMRHIISAAKHELSKSGKLLLKEDFGDYY